MRSFVGPRFLMFAIALLTLLAACGSSDPVEQASEPAEASVAEEESAESDSAETDSAETDSVDEDTAVAETDTSEAETGDTAEVGSSEVESAAGLPDSADDRTPAEIAEDQLDLMIVQLGGRDLEGISACISERLASEGLEISGQGSPELAALIGCEPPVLEELFQLPEVDLDPEIDACIVSGIGDFITSLPLAETDAFFQADRPPNEMVSIISRECDIDFEELLLLIA